MKKKIGFAVAVIAFGLFLGVSYLGYGTLSQGASAGVVKTKTPAPDFEVTDANGNKVKLSDMRGKPTVVNFWASWCPPCKAEMPHFEEAYKELGGDVNFMMVDLTLGGETKEAAEKFISSQGFTFPVYYDKEGDAFKKYNLTAIPMSVFVDAEGNMSGTSLGGINKASLMEGINLARE